MPEPNTPLIERPWEDVACMLDVDAALEMVLAAFGPLPPEFVPLLDAGGRVLADDVLAMEDVPPFRNSAMDGFAVRVRDVAAATWSAPVELPVVADVAAGQREVPELEPGQAIRIMTGAPLPFGADAVVRFEETNGPLPSADGARGTVLIFRPAAPLDNVREAGEDIASGATVAYRGAILSAARLGVIASVGQERVSVHRRPVVGVLSTGNEVVPSGSDLVPGTIRDSNAYVLATLARAWGAEVRLLGIARDTVEDLTGKLNDARGTDLIVTSGGVSLGDYDFVKDVLRAEGEIAVWQVRMKPGKPLAFGKIGGTPLLGVPGNPVAAAVSFILFGRPAIRRMLGDAAVETRTIEVECGEALDNRGQRRHYVRARLNPLPDGRVIATIAGEQGAGVLSSLAAADALLIVPEALERVEPGMRLRAMPLEW